MSSLLQLSPDEQREALAAIVERELGAKIIRFEAIEAGLGTRSLMRLQIQGEFGGVPVEMSAIARIEAPEDPEKRAVGVAPEPALEPLRTFLERAGIPVPRRYCGDKIAGVEIHEDLGGVSLEDIALSAKPRDRKTFYAEACALIPRMQELTAPIAERSPPIAAFTRRLDRALIESKADRVIRWALPFWLGRSPRAAERDIITEAFARIADECEGAPFRFSHRDYKAANIFVREGAPAGKRLVLIDLQGAFMAPPEYDLVCLLRDSHVPLSNEEVTQHLDVIRPRLPDAPSPEEMARRFCLLTLARVAKDAAHYIHAFTHADDKRYLTFLPAARGALADAATRASGWHPAYQHFAEFMADLPAPTSQSDRATQ